MSKDKLVLRPGVELIEYDHPDALFSYYGNPHFQKFTGEAIPIDDLLAFVSEPRTRTEILKRYSSIHGFADNLKRLIKEDFFVEGAGRASNRSKRDPFVHFCSQFHHSLDLSRDRLKRFSRQRLFIVDHLGVGEMLAEAFSSMGIRKVVFTDPDSAPGLPGPGADGMVLVVSSWQNQHRLNTLNRILRERKQEYFLVLLDMFGGSIGPLLGTKHGPCFKCLVLRRDSHLKTSRRSMVEKLEKWAAGRERNVEIGIFEPFAKILLRLAAIEAFKRGVELGDSHGRYGLKEIDLLNIRTQYHEILPAPLCPVCHPAHHTGA